LIGSATVTGTSWSYSATVVDGTTYQFNVKETDLAGNTSAATANFAVTGDTSVTANLTAATDDAGTVTGALTSGDTTDDTLLVLSGTNEAGSTVAVYDGTTLIGSATVTGTSWSYSATVVDGTTYQFNVKETDLAGNTSAATANFAVTGDTTAPVISNVTIPDVAMLVGDVVTVTLTVTDDGGDTYTNLSGTVGGFALSNLSRVNNTTYTAQFTVTEGGTDVAAGVDIPVSVTLDDSAGNTSTAYSTAISQANDTIDANTPTLSSSSPADNSDGAALSDNIVLTFNENIALGTGNIVISDGSDTITIDVASHAGQLAISGSQLTINPTADLANLGNTYNVQIDPSAITDITGNSYAGITDSTTLDFTPTADASIVVFDLVGGTSSSHSGRTFDAGVTYDIYILVDSTSRLLYTDEYSGAGTWGAWAGAANLGSDDKICIVGNISKPKGPDGNFVNSEFFTSNILTRQNFSGPVYALSVGGDFTRWGTTTTTSTGALTSSSVALFASDSMPAFNVTFVVNNVISKHGVTWTAGILTSQGLV